MGLNIVACAYADELNLKGSFVLECDVGTLLLQFLGPLDFVPIPKI